MTVSENVWLAVAEAESVTVMPNVEAPAVVGAPEMTPEDERVKPAGSVPDTTDQA